MLRFAPVESTPNQQPTIALSPGPEIRTASVKSELPKLWMINPRNVLLPATYSHVLLPAVQELAKDAETRGRLNAYAPGKAGESGLESDRLSGSLWAADVWYSIKKHWVMELQQLIRAKRAGGAATASG